jgi:hypothetical protein
MTKCGHKKPPFLLDELVVVIGGKVFSHANGRRSITRELNEPTNRRESSLPKPWL